MAHRSRAKGTRRERELARLACGQRAPLSGAAPGLPGDIVLSYGWRCEVKPRRDGWATLHRSLADADVLALKADRQPWLVVVLPDRFLTLVGGDTGCRQV
ncbi:MAG: hypothetical protein HYU88_04430 [Chloroflexi bacterium]|nr:hypothetical protein [Chloroflexota bacterium]MBI4506755.1 hypothetical protein [Chloroflexota bacterium]